MPQAIKLNAMLKKKAICDCMKNLPIEIPATEGCCWQNWACCELTLQIWQRITAALLDSMPSAASKAQPECTRDSLTVPWRAAAFP